MILQCPECKAKYVVPDRAIGLTGRTVRCAKCAHSWFAEAPQGAEAAAALSDLESVISEVNAKTRKPIPKGSNLPVPPPAPISLMEKGMTLALFIGAGALALLLVMPNLAGFNPSKGLKLSEVSMMQLEGGDNPSYEISGKIINTTPKPIYMPSMRVTLTDEGGNALQYWDLSATPSLLEPGTPLPFSTGNLDVRFTSGKRFVIDIGNRMELLLRQKPPPMATLASSPALTSKDK